ncbi:ABC transporter permease [Aeribacillus sp. FSL K6-2848]|uniref:ABC transporter permease n=1 Tax=Aeribacillus sp. FSL K6-2848 TaxID=2954612 RepID=UPI0030FA72DA
MIGVLTAKLRLFIRKPWLFLMVSILSVVFAMLISSVNKQTIVVPVYSALPESEVKEIIHSLEQYNLFSFKRMKKEEVEKLVGEGKAEAGVELKKDDFRIIVASNTPNSYLVQQTVQKVYAKALQSKSIIDQVKEKQGESSAKQVAKSLAEAKNDPVFTVETKHFRADETVIINSKMQSIFGSVLFFVIYTIAYNVFNILMEKRNGIWDRMILSPVKKWEMYTGNLIYSFATGYIQVALIFAVFHFVFDVDFSDKFWFVLVLLIPYVLAIVAISIFIVGIVNNEQQFHAVLPLVSVSMAMLGGAYWPLEIVSSDALLLLSKFVPVTYGMDLLKGAVVYGYSFSDLLYPMSILFLMAVVFMGLGINIMERKRA